MRTLHDLILPWDRIKHIQTLGIVRSMYVWLFVVPMLANTFSTANNEAQVILFGSTFHVNLELPFSLICFYSSAVLFVIVNITYQLTCPMIIKEHSGWGDFYDNQKNSIELDSYRNNVIDNIPSDNFDEHFALYLKTTVDNESDIKKAFVNLREHANLQRNRWRCFLTFSIYAALLLIFIVSAQNFITVVSISFNL